MGEYRSTVRWDFNFVACLDPDAIRDTPNGPNAPFCPFIRRDAACFTSLYMRTIDKQRSIYYTRHIGDFMSERLCQLRHYSKYNGRVVY